MKKPFVFAMLVYIALAFNQTMAANLTEMSDQELNKLSEEQANNLPAIELLARLGSMPDKGKSSIALESAKTKIIFGIEESLYELKFYPRLPQGKITLEFIEAIKKFQILINKPATGELLFGEFSLLAKNSQLNKFQKIYPSGTGDPLIYRNNGYVSVEGTWTIQGDKIVYPINKAKIVCILQTKVCEEIGAEIWNFNTSSDNSSMLALNSVSYDIKKWDTHEVVAESLHECRINVLTINTSSKEIFQMTRNTTNEKCSVAGFDVPKLEKPKIAQLVNGYKIAEDYYKLRQEDRLKTLNPEYRKILESVQK